MFINPKTFAEFDNTAEYAKLPIIPPFRQPYAEYTNGVNFASGGAGILSETNQGLVRIFFLNKHILLKKITIVVSDSSLPGWF